MLGDMFADQNKQLAEEESKAVENDDPPKF
jgi:hypothetical protein